MHASSDVPLPSFIRRTVELRPKLRAIVEEFVEDLDPPAVDELIDALLEEAMPVVWAKWRNADRVFALPKRTVLHNPITEGEREQAAWMRGYNAALTSAKEALTAGDYAAGRTGS